MVASAFLRKIGVLDSANPSSYKRFSSHPKSDTTCILYRGDTRDPVMIKQLGGFFPQRGKSHVSESGGSTAMVCLTIDPSVAVTYYAFVKQYYGSPTWGKTNKPNGFVYCVYLPTGRGILNYKMAIEQKSQNAGSQEISALVIPWRHVVGWRQLLKPEDCQPPKGQQQHFVGFFADFEANEDFNGDLAIASLESVVCLKELIGSSDILVYNSNHL
jgi:hypothetical protein